MSRRSRKKEQEKEVKKCLFPGKALMKRQHIGTRRKFANRDGGSLLQPLEETDESKADHEQSQRSVIEGDRQEGEVFN